MIDNNNKPKILNFTKFSQRVFSEINYARSNPAGYAKKLDRLAASFEEKENLVNLNGFGIYIQEGLKAFDDAINFLNNMKPLDSITLTQAISQSADELLNLLILHDGIPDMTMHEKSNYDVEKRMNHYGAAFGELDELIDYGTFDPEFVAANFILCDGDPKRKERSIIFNPLIKYGGVASGFLPSEQVCTVINFAAYFFHPGEHVPQILLNKYLNQSTNTSQNTPNTNSQHGKTPVRRKDSCQHYKEKEQKFKDYGHKHAEGHINLKESNEYIKHANQTMSKMNIQDQEEDESEMELPNGVEKVKYVERVVQDKQTGIEKIIVKKITYYTDGNTETTIYQKNK